ncbi:hypothetical protein OJ997_11185 [Solirubrobacter phytolaccae]|uniref:Plant heme peroxidase family profile domain-containing protein n=1 Tax=Solirubrobacter phytolaccae TaxID=1404360 RepID=A0A9X3S7Y4_9ACTN|nr:hypothetical protein [Solirubrobacter phytolaccae]MDA0180858.1 hypothetical protein [Solirubrobacter phytolaccae]
MKRSALISALVAGALAGAAGAAVQAQEPAAPAPAPIAAATATPVPVPTAAPRGRTADGRYDSSYTHYRVRNVSYPVRVEDPAGGLPWVVKAFEADRLTLDAPARTLKGAHVIGRNRCVQLGRLDGQTFGWVYGDGVFRRTGIEDRLMQCTSRKRPATIVSLRSTLAITDPAAPKLAGSVVYGLLPGASSVTVTGTGAADGAAATRDGVFLKVGGPNARPGGSITAGGKTYEINPIAEFPVGRRITFPTLLPGAQLAEAPAPDPGGGPRWALPVARTKEGTPCVGQPARVVEDRAGDVDLALGLFTESRPNGQYCRPLETRPDAKTPCDIGWGYRADVELERNDAFLAQARSERRLQSGRSTVNGQCSAEVERVTLQTPRDVRTLVPSEVGRAFLAVYDGDFIDGELKVTAHLRGGKTWTQEFPLGF